MNFIRGILPGGGHRMKSDNKSLDIAKITPRMYAMSYPSDKFIESMYHNNQDDIAEYLNKNHEKKYLIFNLSGIPYDSKKFNDSVITYYWPDHKAPPLYDIFNIIYQAYNYLRKNKENVICVHCLAGKGRTGTICCSLLLYGKLIRCSKEANDYFSYKRFKKLNKGVQEPSQVRYIEYFDIMLNSQKFRGLELKAFEIKSIHVTGIKLKDGESLIYKVETSLYKEDEADKYLSNNKGQIVVGDVTVNIYRNGALKAWVLFNTSFLDYRENRLFFRIKDIDPRFLVKQPDYDLMSVEIEMTPYYYSNQNNNNSNNNNFNNNNQNNNMNFNRRDSNNNNFNNYNMNNNNNFNQNNNNNYNQNNFNNFNQNNNNNFNQNNNGNYNNFNQNINNNNYQNQNLNNQNNNNFNQNNNNNFNQNNFNQNNNDNFNQNNNNNFNQNNNDNFSQNNNNNFNQNNNNNFNQNNNNNFNQDNNNNFNQNNNNNNNNFNNINQNNNIFNNFNQNNNNNFNQNNNFNNFNQNNNNNNFNQNNNFNNFNQNNNNNFDQNNNNNNFSQNNNFNNFNQNNNNNFNQNNNNNNFNNFNQNNNNNCNFNNFNQNNNNNFNNYNQNNNMNFNNQNQNNCSKGNYTGNLLVDNMLSKEMQRIRRMNEFIYYSNTKNSSQFYSENKVLFFGDELDDTFDTLNEIKNL